MRSSCSRTAVWSDSLLNLSEITVTPEPQTAPGWQPFRHPRGWLLPLHTRPGRPQLSPSAEMVAAWVVPFIQGESPCHGSSGQTDQTVEGMLHDSQAPVYSRTRCA